jgi:hypothetical protein
MRHPHGYEDKSMPNYVCKLDKVLYGFKQAPRAWFSWLSAKLLSLDFKASKADTSLFYFNKDDVSMFILVYVDDIIVVSSTQGAATALLKGFNKKFALMDLGELHYFLGIEVNKMLDGIILTQDKYVSDLLKKVGMSIILTQDKCVSDLLKKMGMSDCKPVSTPLSVIG